MTPRHFATQAGIAIGPILFVIAILGLLAMVMASNIGEFGTASVVDRVTADLQSQANLIRTKILECNIKYGTNNNGDGYPASDTSNGTLASALNCEGDPAGLQNLWSGMRSAVYPSPSPGFGAWYYINTNGLGFGGTAIGGRCIWIIPTVSNPLNNAGIVEGLTKVASRFTHQTTCSDAASCAASEVIYNPASSSQKFVLWITLPTGAPDSHCLP